MSVNGIHVATIEFRSGSYLVRLVGVGFSAALGLDSSAAAGSVAAAVSPSLAASVAASGVSVAAAAGVSVAAASAGVSATVSSFLSSALTSLAAEESPFLLPPRRAPKIEARFLLAERLRSSFLVSAPSSLASSLASPSVVSVVAAAASVVAGTAAPSAAGVSSAALVASVSAFLSSVFSSFFSSFLTAGEKEARVALYCSDSVTVLASSLASVIFSLIWLTQLSRSAAVPALKVCLCPLEDRTNLLGPSGVGSAASCLMEGQRTCRRVRDGAGNSRVRWRWWARSCPGPSR